MPTYLVSEYGDLLNIRPVQKSKTLKTGKMDLRKVKMINDNTTAKTLLKSLNQHPNTYFLFDPQSHYINSRSLYQALKKQLNHNYYGKVTVAKKKKIDEKHGQNIDDFDEFEGEYSERELNDIKKA